MLEIGAAELLPAVGGGWPQRLRHDALASMRCGSAEGEIASRRSDPSRGTARRIAMPDRRRNQLAAGGIAAAGDEVPGSASRSVSSPGRTTAPWEAMVAISLQGRGIEPVESAMTGLSL
jgi:hypothetical protein